ncbi:hypothetical protein MBLNU457_g2618t1 [Dothideomycetes sp. NU457]
MAPPTSGPCAYCDSPGKTLKCDSCADAPTKDLKRTRTTFFCNEECKKNIWESHQKDTCRAGSARKALKLFADTLQKAWLLICKESSALVALRVHQVSPKEFHVYVDATPSRLPRTSDGTVPPLARHIWETLSDNDHATILTAGNRFDALMHCDATVKAYIGGLCERIEEVTVYVQKPERLVAMINQLGDIQKNDEYCVLKVTLRNGAGDFIIDLSGAQFGFYDYLVPYQTFHERQIHNVRFERKWGRTGIEEYEDLCIYKGPIPPVTATDMQAIVTSRSGYIFKSEYTEYMNMIMKARGSLATATPEKVQQIITSDLKWQKAFLTDVEVSIKRAAREADGRIATIMADSMRKFQRDPHERPPFRGYGDILSYDGNGSRPTS